MSASRPWIRAAALAGVWYALVGITFAVPTAHAKAWRWSAWVVCALVFAAHIAYERFRLRGAPSSSALQVAAGVALGAFGLAAGANFHALASASAQPHGSLLLASLVIWPVITAVPAFLVALVASFVLARSTSR